MAAYHDPLALSPAPVGLRRVDLRGRTLSPFPLSAALLLLSAFAPALGAQVIGSVSPGQANSWSMAASYGGTFDGNAWLWGVSTDYTRVLAENWLANVSLAFDEETQSRLGSPDDVSNSFSIQVAGGKQLSRRFAVGAGFGKGLLSTSEEGSGWTWQKFSDDWAVGAVGALAFLMRGPHTMDISASLEYRINEKRAGYSFDLGYGYSF